MVMTCFVPFWYSHQKSGYTNPGLLSYCQNLIRNVSVIKLIFLYKLLKAPSVSMKQLLNLTITESLFWLSYKNKHWIKFGWKKQMKEGMVRNPPVPCFVVLLHLLHPALDIARLWTKIVSGPLLANLSLKSILTIRNALCFVRQWCVHCIIWDQKLQIWHNVICWAKQIKVCCQHHGNWPHQ